MSDLIDRQVAIEAIARRDTTDGTVKVFGGREVVEIIKSLPSAQPKIDGRKEESAQNVPKEDLISRKAAIEAMDGFNACGYVEEPFERLEKALKEIPAAQSERKTGQWLQISPAGIYECSECAQTVMTEDIGCYKYCHGCGAYMGGDEE